MLTYRPVNIPACSRCLKLLLSTFVMLPYSVAKEGTIEEWNWFRPWPCHGPLYPWWKITGRLFAPPLTLAYLINKTQKSAFEKVTDCLLQGPPSWRECFREFWTRIPERMLKIWEKTSTHVQQSLRAGEHVLTVTEGRWACFYSHCGPVSKF